MEALDSGARRICMSHSEGWEGKKREGGSKEQQEQLAAQPASVLSHMTPTCCLAA